MKNPEVELGQYRQQIYRDGVFLLDTRLRFLEEFGEAKNKLVWNSLLGGTASIFYESLFDNLIVTLSWIYSESSIDKRSLMWYLTQVKAHSKFFSDEEIEEQIERIRAVKDIAEKIHIVRNQWIAHRDPKAINDPVSFLQSYKATIEDFDVLVELAEDIIEEHFLRFENTAIDFELPVNGIDALTACIKSRNDLQEYLLEIDLSCGKANSEERKQLALESLLQKQN